MHTPKISVVLLTCGTNVVVVILDVETETRMLSIRHPQFKVVYCAWVPDSKTFFCASLHSKKGIYRFDCKGNVLMAWDGMGMPKILDPRRLQMGSTFVDSRSHGPEAAINDTHTTQSINKFQSSLNRLNASPEVQRTLLLPSVSIANSLTSIVNPQQPAGHGRLKSSTAAQSKPQSCFRRQRSCNVMVNNDVSGRFCGENYFAQFVSETSFMCKHGKAYLFDNVVNVTVGEKEDRMMITGVHTVVDIFCVGCGSILGWKYEVAHDKSQKYKEGKFILERFKVLGPDGSSYSYTQEVQMAGNDADD
ncbi:hypothetical protein RD792_011794 [Penstemon davidsonii]|uniref:Yippee domain-containing protein n=1 Tax=Penstemon davidsonii TaxID=160366 RepID=A0ABR0CWR8_9LAMI|nr:hypothetical protein RD792_011794 [Penstemon davidsonii]